MFVLLHFSLSKCSSKINLIPQPPNQLIPSHHTRSGTHWTTTNLTPTAPKTLTYEHTLNADFGSCTCDTAMYVVINVCLSL